MNLINLSRFRLNRFDIVLHIYTSHFWQEYPCTTFSLSASIKSSRVSLKNSHQRRRVFLEIVKFSDSIPRCCVMFVENISRNTLSWVIWVWPTLEARQGTYDLNSMAVHVSCCFVSRSLVAVNSVSSRGYEWP